jgi:DNA modification methylase
MGKNAKVTDSEVKSKYQNFDDNLENYLEFLIQFTNGCLENTEYTFVDIQQLANNKIDFIDYLHHFKLNFCDRIIWNKEQAAPAMAINITNSQFEDIIIFRSEPNPTRTITSGKIFHGTISNVYNGKPQKNNDIADILKATFPLHLPLFIIQNFSLENDIILDPFLGSGSTLIACEQTKRICYGMEIDPAYIDVIIERWENFTGKKAVKISNEDILSKEEITV